MHLYILESLLDDSHYVGISNNLKSRLEYHNRGKVKSTKSKRPWVMIYNEKHVDLKSAREREKYLKSYKSIKEKRGIISRYTKK